MIVSMVALVGAGCAASLESDEPAIAEIEGSLDRPTGTDAHDADVARAWMSLMMDRVRAEAFNPPMASRVYGYAGVTLYEAVVAGMAPTHRSLAGQLNGLPAIETPHARRGLDWPSAANAALRVVAGELFAGRSEATRTAIDALHRTQADARRAAGVRSSDLRASEEFGREVGRAIVRWSRTDGFTQTRGRLFAPAAGPQFWVPTGDAPPGTLPAEPYWGTLRPFVLPSQDACAPAPPAAYSEQSDSEFFAQAAAVYETNLSLTDEQRTIATYWADNAGATPTPAGHWIGIATDLLADASLAEAAETYALVSIAGVDAFIACWDAKYTYNLLRPETYIRRFIDAEWRPLIPTPQFPEYTSGHSTVSAAAASVLTDLYGDVAFTEVTPVQPGFAPRSFQSFTAAAAEAARSRLYGGIHYPMGNDNGALQGQCVAGHVQQLETRR
jgi:hypothetical protein